VRPEIEGLFTGPGRDVHLLAGRCEECRSTFFPRFAEIHRPGCSGGTTEEFVLGRQATVVSYTVQRFAPPEPFPATDPYVPMIMVTALFEEGLQIPGQLIGVDSDVAPMGAEVETVADVLWVAEDGTEMVTWKFSLLGST
jgi:hypothetical protein